MRADIHLSDLEWQAVSVALNDAAGCGCRATSAPRQGRIARLWQAAFPAKGVRPLADPRLEAVRRFVCETRRHRRPAEEHRPALAELGYNPRQIEALTLLSA